PPRARCRSDAPAALRLPLLRARWGLGLAAPAPARGALLRTRRAPRRRDRADDAPARRLRHTLGRPLRARARALARAALPHLPPGLVRLHGAARPRARGGGALGTRALYGPRALRARGARGRPGARLLRDLPRRQRPRSAGRARPAPVGRERGVRARPPPAPRVARPGARLPDRGRRERLRRRGGAPRRRTPRGLRRGLRGALVREPDRARALLHRALAAPPRPLPARRLRARPRPARAAPRLAAAPRAGARRGGDRARRGGAAAPGPRRGAWPPRGAPHAGAGTSRLRDPVPARRVPRPGGARRRDQLRGAGLHVLPRRAHD